MGPAVREVPPPVVDNGLLRLYRVTVPPPQLVSSLRSRILLEGLELLVLGVLLGGRPSLDPFGEPIVVGQSMAPAHLVHQAVPPGVDLLSSHSRQYSQYYIAHGTQLS